MFTKRKTFIVILCLLICLTVIPIPQAMAVDVAVFNENSEILPLMEYIYSASHDFSISDGNASMYAAVNGHSSKATKCEITIELQEKGILFWDTVETWNAVEYGRRADLEVSKEVTSGKLYRMVTTVTVWSGSDSETKTMTSDAVKA